MTAGEFRAIRLALGLTLDQWGEVLGYEGPHRRQQVHMMETGLRPVTARTARLALMISWHPRDIARLMAVREAP